MADFALNSEWGHKDAWRFNMKSKFFYLKFVSLLMLVFSIFGVSPASADSSQYDYNQLVAEGRSKSKDGHVCWFVSSFGRKNETKQSDMVRYVASQISCGQGKEFKEVLAEGRVRCVKPDNQWYETPVACKQEFAHSATKCGDDSSTFVYSPEEFLKEHGSMNALAQHKAKVLGKSEVHVQE